MLTGKMQFPLAADFVDKKSGGRVPGLIHIAVEEHLLLWTSWRYRPRDEDRTWDWWSIFQECKVSGGQFESYAAFAAGNLQGLMALDLAGERTGMAKGIIVDYLATNPTNRTAGRGLKYVGFGWNHSREPPVSMRAWAWPNSPADRRRETRFTHSKWRRRNNCLMKSKGEA